MRTLLGFINATGDYYEGDRLAFNDTEVEIRPSGNYKYLDGIWTLDIQVLKDKKVEELSASCEIEIISGFISNALGTGHLYQSDRDDQLNLLGVQGSDGAFKCSVDNGVTWEYVLHTSAQLSTVLSDGRIFKSDLLIKFNTLKTQVVAVTTQIELDLIIW